MMPTISSMPSFCLLGQNGQKLQIMSFFGHVILLASSMAQLHILCQGDQNEVQHDFMFIDTDVSVT